MLIKRGALLGIGFAGGVSVAAGIYAFITMLQIMQRLSSKTGTANQINFYEDCVMVGGILGNLVSVFQWRLPFGVVFLTMYGLFSGIFVGCLAIALAEVIDVIPAVARRISLTVGIPYLVVAIGLGKCVGSLYQLIMNRG